MKMLRLVVSFLLLYFRGYEAFAASSGQDEGAPFDVFQYIDQLIGTDNMGNVFAGATLRRLETIAITS